MILQLHQRISFIQPCRLVSCELACLLYPSARYPKAEPCPLGASLCLTCTEGRFNSLSDHILSQFPCFCSGSYYLSFLPASEILPCLTPGLCFPHPTTQVRAAFQLSLRFLTAASFQLPNCHPAPTLHHLAIPMACWPFPLFLNVESNNLKHGHVFLKKTLSYPEYSCGSRVYYLWVTNSWSGEENVLHKRGRCAQSPRWPPQLRITAFWVSCPCAASFHTVSWLVCMTREHGRSDGKSSLRLGCKHHWDLCVCVCVCVCELALRTVRTLRQPKQHGLLPKATSRE